MTEEEIKQFAAQLRMPHGTSGIEVAQKMNEGNKPMNLHTISAVNPEANDAILEIGMGNGFFVKNILNLDASIKYTGCDFSELMVAEASNINKPFIQTGQASFYMADIETLPFNNQAFNKIFTINTLYFWKNPEQILKELKRVLAVDGALFISIRPKHVMQLYPVTQYGFTLYSKEELCALVEKNGFIVDEITEIKEPPQKLWGKVLERETLVVKCLIRK